MNLCVFTGRLTRDPELTYTNSGKAVVEFSVAVNEGKDQSGQDRVTFANCQAWDQTAESVAKFFTKGKPITVQARLRNERWTDPEGQQRRAEKFVVDRFNFVPSDNKSGNPEDGNEEAAQAPPARAAAPARKPRSGGESARRPTRTAPAPVVADDNDGFSPSAGDDDIPF